MTREAGIVEITRGDFVESRHIVHVVVAHADEGIVASCGNPALVTFVRSAIKMFQALPLVEDGVVESRGMTTEELAVCVASHNAEPFHVDAVGRLLGKAGVEETALACGPHPPMYPPAAARLEAAGEVPGRIHNNCSGKHAGMLALCAHHAWPRAGYHQPDHPAQQRVARILASWTGVEVTTMGVGIDGCGLPTFALPLQAVAMGCARFAAAAQRASAPGVIVDAMTRHPEYVAGTARLCTAVMRIASDRRLFAKVGAEGYYCAGIPDRRLGIALKVEDGAKRASEPALLATLHAMGVLSTADLASLGDFAAPRVINTLGAEVGEVRTRLWD
jgi:L-asparaginase II